MKKKWNNACRRLRTAFGVMLVALVAIVGLNVAAADEKPPLRHGVRVGFFPLPGYHETDANGRKSGYGYEYLQNLSRYAPWQYDFTAANRDWAAMLPMLEAGEIDMLSYVHKTPERLQRFAFSRIPVGYSAAILTVKAGTTRYKQGDYANWNGIRVGLLRENAQNVSFTTLAEQKGFTYTPVYYDSMIRLLEDMLSGKNIDAAVTGNLRKISGEWIYEQFDFSPFFIVVRRDNPELLREVDHAMDQLNQLEPQISAVLWARYYSQSDADKISYTPDERDFILRAGRTKQIFTAVINPDRKPFSYYEDGALKGVLAELSAEIIKRTGLAVRIVPQQTRTEYYRSTLDPEINLVLDSLNDYSVAEQKKLILCGAYLKSEVSFLHRKDFCGNARTIAGVEGSDLLPSLVALMMPEARLVRYVSTAEAVKAVVKGRADGVFLYTDTAEYVISSDFRGLLTAHGVAAPASSYTIGVRDNTDPLLASIFSKAVSSINGERIAEIKAKYADMIHLPFSWRSFLYANPALAFGVPLGILTLIILLLTLLLFTHRKMVRRAEVIKLLPLRYCVVGENGRFLDISGGVNPPTEQHPHASPVAAVITGEMKKTIRKHCIEAMKSAQSTTIHYEDGGARRTATISILPYRAFNQNAVVWISQDTSELQNSRRNAQQLAEYFRLTLHSIGDGVIVTDDAGKITMMNPVAEALIGCGGMDFIGAPHEEYFRIVSYIDDTPVRSPVRKTLESGEIVELTNHTDLLSFTGQRHHIADSSAPIKGSDGKIIGVILVFRDVTAEYESRDRLRAALAAMEIGSEMMDAAAFMMDPATRKVTGSHHLAALWPVCDGVAMAYQERVLAEDLAHFEHLLMRLYDGHDKRAVVDFRARQNGVLRHYRLCVEKDVSVNQSLRLVGAIQDLTEITATVVKLKETQQLWDMVADAIPVMLFVKNADDGLRYLLSNRANQELVGRTAEELVGRCDADIFRNPENVREFVARDQRIIASGTAQTFFEDVVSADNQLHHLQTTKIPFKGVHGEQLLLGVSSDVTELSALLRNQTFINSCLETLLQDGTPENAIATVVRFVAEHLGATRGYVMAIDSERRVETIFTEYCAPGAVLIFNGCVNVPLAHTEPLSGIFTKREALFLGDLTKPATRGQLGSWAGFAVEHDICSIAMAGIFLNGKIWGDIGVCYEHEPRRQFSDTDRNLLSAVAKFIELMLERQHSRERLLAAAQQAQAADKAKSYFIASVSHEIRTPLNAVIGFAELLSEGVDDACARKEYIDNIAISGKALLELINDVLDLSKLEAGQLEFTPVETDFEQLAMEVGAVFRLARERKNLQANYEIAPMPLLYLDRLRLRQILFNLMGNALKFTREGALTLRAAFTRDSDKTGTLAIQVIDTGVGISEADQKTLFEPFVQAKAMRGTYAAKRGTGLGLAICRRMAEKMNGTITLESQPGRGSTFSVVLSAIPYQEVADTAVRDAEAAPVVPAADRRILLVDDVAMNLQVLGAMLTKLGYHPLKAASGPEALVQLEQNECDLVLTDLWMPEMNGVELAVAIRQNPRLNALRLIAVTADVESNIHFDLGCFDGILTKPISLDKLRTALAAISRSKQHR